MRILRTIIAAATLSLCGIGAMAQECGQGECCKEAQDLGYKPYPYSFIQVQGGFGTTLTDVSAFKLLTPTYSIAFGRMFTPIVGARVHVNGYESKGGFDVKGMRADYAYSNPLKYKYNYINSNIDLMLNLNNIFSKNCHHLLDVYFIGGVGLNYAWHNNEFNNIVSAVNTGADISNAWGEGRMRENLLSHNIRAGLLFDLNVDKHWSIGAEIDANSLDDRFNSKYKDADDWMITAQLSVTYKFGFKKACKPAPVPVVVPQPEPQPVVEQPKPEPKPEPVVVVKEEPLKETIFYAIRESDPDKEAILNRVVAWCNKYPNKNITIDGYADKGTGNAKLNVGYAKARAEKVAKALQEKGIAASRMTVKSYGDAVQPFEENDRNRCVIIVGE